jgi:hypothetical protein
MENGEKAGTGEKQRERTATHLAHRAQKGLGARALRAARGRRLQQHGADARADWVRERTHRRGLDGGEEQVAGAVLGAATSSELVFWTDRQYEERGEASKKGRSKEGEKRATHAGISTDTPTIVAASRTAHAEYGFSATRAARVRGAA